jgi:opacity protein-like surface antigen
MTHFRVRRALAATTILALWIAPAFGQTGTANTYETHIRRLGTSQRFSMPMKTVDDLHAMANKNRTQFNQVLSMAGLSAISGQVLDTLTGGPVTETMIQPGTHMEWMAMKRSGTPAVVKNVRWSGREAFGAWQFSITDSGFTYNFLVPKVCGNLTLLNTVSTPAGTLSEAQPEPTPPPPPPPAPPEPPAPIAAAPPPPPPPAPYVPTRTHTPWIASANIGTSFGTSFGNDVNTVAGTVNVDSNVPSTLAYAFQVGYMWHDVWGAEFLADFAPDAGFDSLVLARQPHVNSYMANLIAALPIGEGRFEPYISGGLGRVGISADVFTLPDINGDVSTVSADRSRLGYDVGGGVMAFADRRFGVRGDVRYFRGSSHNTLTTDESRERLVTDGLLSDLGFWHGTVGLAFRW